MVLLTAEESNSSRHAIHTKTWCAIGKDTAIQKPLGNGSPREAQIAQVMASKATKQTVCSPWPVQILGGVVAVITAISGRSTRSQEVISDAPWLTPSDSGQPTRDHIQCHRVGDPVDNPSESLRKQFQRDTRHPRARSCSSDLCRHL